MTTFQDFDSMTDLCKVAASLPNAPHRQASWAGCGTLAEAIRIAEQGWSEPRADVLSISGDILATVKRTVDVSHAPFHDVTGAFVDIGAYLQGVPECMVAFPPEETAKHGKVVTILFSVSILGHESADRIKRRGAVIGALVEILATLGHSTILYAERCIRKGERELSQLVQVKGASDLFDIDNLMFAMAHPAMLRHLCFDAGSVIGFDPATPIACQRAESVAADVVIDVNADGANSNADRMIDHPVQYIIDTLTELGIEVN